MWSSGKDWSDGMVGSLNLTTARLLILPPLPTELRLRLSQQPRCLAAAVCTRSFLKSKLPHLFSQRTRNTEATCSTRPFRALEWSQGSTTRGWLLLHTFVHFAAAISGDSCTGRSSWQLSSEPAPPATRSGKAYIVQAARCRHNFDLGDLLVA